MPSLSARIGIPSADDDRIGPRRHPDRRAAAVLLGIRAGLRRLVVAVLFFAWSLSPSLIPREWLYQGLVSGITSVTGYGIGVLLAYPARRWIGPRLMWWRRRRTARIIAQIVVAVLALITVTGSLLVAANWQNDIRALMGIDDTTSFAYLRTGLVSVAVFAVLLLIGRGLRRVAHGSHGSSAHGCVSRFRPLT